MVSSTWHTDHWQLSALFKSKYIVLIPCEKPWWYTAFLFFTSTRYGCMNLYTNMAQVHLRWDTIPDAAVRNQAPPSGIKHGTSLLRSMLHPLHRCDSKKYCWNLCWLLIFQAWCYAPKLWSGTTSSKFRNNQWTREEISTGQSRDRHSYRCSEL